RDYTEEFTRNFFEHEFMIGRKAEKELTLKYLPTITVAEMNALAKSFGGADNRVILISGPDASKATLPTRDRVLAIVDEVARRPIEPWEDRAVTAQLMPEPPRPGKITRETKVDAIGVTDWRLSNGARVIVKPTDYQADQVALLGSSPGGMAIAKDKDFDDD